MNTRKAISYLFPTKVKSGITSKGQVYEINFENGYKVLNSQNANYSYGSLHQIMQKGIFESLKKIKPQNILMLGLGGGSAVEILSKKCAWPFKVTAIEFDEDLVQFAREEFDINQYQMLTIVVADAFEWLQTPNTEQYDLIIDDLFVDDQVPELCFGRTYLTQLTQRLTDGGIYFRNMMNLTTEKQNRYEKILKDVFPNTNCTKAKGYDNLIYLCSKS
ncbi:MAG: fused MFS/spermidine synthase [bacterium]|nr:fused MFS/spermidine synthase [bacterium]